MFGFKKQDKKIIINNQEVKDDLISETSIDMKKEYILNILKAKKLPIVLLDPLWHITREQIKSKAIDQKEKELQELLKEQGRLNNDFKEYTSIKKKFLGQILEVSSAVQNSEDPGALDELNALHQSTIGVNEKIEAIEERLEHIEEDIEGKNKELVSEMVAIGYGYIEGYKEEAEKLEVEIEALRAEMLRKTNKKKEDEAFLKDIYKYLHSIIGREHIEIIDKTLIDKKE